MCHGILVFICALTFFINQHLYVVTFNLLTLNADSPHEQNLKTMKSSQKSGTQCVIVPENKKVMAPRNLELITKTVEKDQTEDLINKEIEDMQLTTNVAINLADELFKDYLLDGDLLSVDIRLPNSSKATEAENTNSAVKELLIPWTQSSQSSDQLPNSDLKNIQESHASFTSTSTESCPQTQSSEADLSEMLQTLETGSAFGNEMMLSPEAGFEMLQNLEASFKDDNEISNSQEAALEPDGEMSGMDSRFFQSDPAKNCREDADCCTTTVPSDHHKGFEGETDMDQEMTCDDLPEEIPRDKFSLGYIYII